MTSPGRTRAHTNGKRQLIGARFFQRLRGHNETKFGAARQAPQRNTDFRTGQRTAQTDMALV